MKTLILPSTTGLLSRDIILEDSVEVNPPVCDTNEPSNKTRFLCTPLTDPPSDSGPVKVMLPLIFDKST